MMIHVEHLTRRYGEFTAVNDVSFSIGKGEVVGLLGHNGAGKTTIMKMITGYLEPTQGSIVVDGRRIETDTAAIQSRIGYLPENCPLWPEMTVIDYLTYQAGLHGVVPSRRQAAVARAIGRTALKDKAKAPIHTLSRGYRQRVGVAQAILHDPAIVILDEPTNGLDPTQIFHMRNLITELAETATVLVSTHILQEVQAVCKRVLILRSGRLVVDADLDTLQQSHSLLVAVDGDAGNILSGIEGVTTSTELEKENGLWRYRVAADPATAPRIAHTLLQAGFALHQLQPEYRNLETVFAQVNEEVAHA